MQIIRLITRRFCKIFQAEWEVTKIQKVQGWAASLWRKNFFILSVFISQTTSFLLSFVRQWIRLTSMMMNYHFLVFYSFPDDKSFSNFSISSKWQNIFVLFADFRTFLQLKIHHRSFYHFYPFSDRFPLQTWIHKWLLQCFCRSWNSINPLNPIQSLEKVFHPSIFFCCFIIWILNDKPRGLNIHFEHAK